MPRLPSGLRRFWLGLSQAPPPKLLSRLPVELLLEIASHLPLPSQVCFALSCRDLYRLLGAVLATDALHFPRVPLRRLTARSLSDRYLVGEEYRLRMELLVLLEDSRWACCALWQKLHPRPEFHPQYFTWFVFRRICITGAGLVDLCPCIVLTLRDRRKIVECLMGRGKR